MEDYQEYDFSEIISNQLRFDRDPWSTYIGVFGPKNRRIDFHLIATQIDSETYIIKGKSKLGQHIREMSGEVHLRKVMEIKDMALILIYEYNLNESGDRGGEGTFIGIGTILFTIKDGEPKLF